jgi:hypothetical protein
LVPNDLKFLLTHAGLKMEQDQRKSSLERQIEENLKKVYRRTVEEDVPDRFAELLRQLKEQDDAK